MVKTGLMLTFSSDRTRSNEMNAWFNRVDIQKAQQWPPFKYFWS